jgi:hypothetical protein
VNPIVRIIRCALAVLQSWQREPRPAHSGESIDGDRALHAYYQHVEREKGEPWSI